jgi:hypothetical protein
VDTTYGQQDQAWAHTLAENLHLAGLDVFLDAWEIVPGVGSFTSWSRGLLASCNGYWWSARSTARPWLQQECTVPWSGQSGLPTFELLLPPLVAERLGDLVPRHTFRTGTLAALAGQHDLGLCSGPPTREPCQHAAGSQSGG